MRSHMGWWKCHNYWANCVIRRMRRSPIRVSYVCDVRAWMGMCMCTCMYVDVDVDVHMDVDVYVCVCVCVCDVCACVYMCMCMCMCVRMCIRCWLNLSCSYACHPSHVDASRSWCRTLLDQPVGLRKSSRMCQISKCPIGTLE